MTNQNKTDIGLIGLAVMGENLALNMEELNINDEDRKYSFVAFGEKSSKIVEGLKNV